MIIHGKCDVIKRAGGGGGGGERIIVNSSVTEGVGRGSKT